MLSHLNPTSLWTGTSAEDQSSHWPWACSSFKGIISFRKKKTICESTLTALSPHQGWWPPWHQSEFWAKEFGLSFVLLRQDRRIKRCNISSIFLIFLNMSFVSFFFDRNTEKMFSYMFFTSEISSLCIRENWVWQVWVTTTNTCIDCLLFAKD